MIFALAVAQDAGKEQPLTSGGWIFMLISVAFVTVLTAWCFYRVVRQRDEPRS